MGKCLSRSKEDEEDEHTVEVRAGDGEDGEKTFAEKEEERRSLDGSEKKEVGGRRRRRKSSGVSRFSTKDQHVVEKPFRVAAFNVRRFGPTKMKDVAVVDVLVRIIRQFEIILIQEVVDSGGRAVEELLEKVNQAGEEEGEYQVIISGRLGRGKQKEQYAFFYKAGRAEVVSEETYPDPGDVYMREPFVVHFKVRGVSDLEKLVLLGLHTQPTSAVVEIDALVDVVAWAQEVGHPEVLILGDLNAGGTYFSGKEATSCRARSHPDFHWLIPDHIDTTATSTLAAYDRIIVVGEQLRSSVIPGSAGVLRFDEQMGLGEEDLLKVSDHFPVCLDLRPSVHQSVAKNIEARIGVVIKDKRFPDCDLAQLASNFKAPRLKMFTYFDENQQLTRIEIRSQKLSSRADAVRCLENLRDRFEPLVSYSLLASVRHKVLCGDLSDGSVKVAEKDDAVWLLLTAEIPKKELICSVQIKSSIT